MELSKGTCMMCLKNPVEVRHINLYLTGSEGFFCCKNCENEVLEFICKKRCKNSMKKKNYLSKNLKKEVRNNDIH